MHDHHSFNEEHRFGSAGFATEADLRRAGLFDHGLQIGYFGNKPLRLEGDAPLITIGGAGSGKCRDQLGFVVCNSPGVRIQALDPRGELGAISIHNHARNGEYAYFWNPVGVCDLPQHRCNPLDILKASSPNFHADCKFIAESLIPLSGSSNGQYFELRAREWVENLMKSRVEQKRGTSFPDLHRVINAIESNPKRWAAQLEAMLGSKFESARRTAGEMLTKQQDSPKEFGSIMGSLYAALNFLDDPVLLASLENPDFSLEALCHPKRVVKLFLNVPIEYVGIWSPILRTFFTVTMLYKSRHPERERITLIVDEAGQMGRFEALLRSFTYGRGAGIRCWAVFQDVGQIVRNFGGPALQGFLGSAQARMFFGVRDYETAQLVSEMLGSETLEYDDHPQQDAARRKKWNTVRRTMVDGADPFEAAYDYAHYTRNAKHRTKQARPLMTPDEVLAMPEDRQILFISGKDLKPIYANKYPYYSRREMAGLYLPNPYHPPVDKVRIKTRWGSEWRPIITEPVPDALAGFPQYQSGKWSYVKGFKPPF